MGISFKTGLVTGPAILAAALLFGAMNTASAEDDVIFGSLGGCCTDTADRTNGGSGKKVNRRGRRNCVNGQGGSDVIIGSTGLSGKSRDGTRYGGSGNDILIGNRGNDRQRRSGPAGDDLLAGNNDDGSEFNRRSRRNCGNTGGDRAGARSSTR